MAIRHRRLARSCGDSCGGGATTATAPGRPWPAAGGCTVTCAGPWADGSEEMTSPTLGTSSWVSTWNNV